MIKNDPYTKTTRQIPSQLRTWRKKKPRIQHPNTKTTQIQKQNNNPKHIKQRTTIQHQTKQIRKRSNRQHNRNIQRRPKIPTQTSNRRTNNPINHIHNQKKNQTRTNTQQRQIPNIHTIPINIPHANNNTIKTM